MKQHSDIRMERLIKEAVCDMVESANPPPLEESWGKFEKKLKEQRNLQRKPHMDKRKIFSTWRFTVAAGVIMLLAITSSMFFPVKARAIGEKITRTVVTLLGGTQVNVTTEYKNDEPNGAAPPPEDFKEVPIQQERIVSLEEAKSASPFQVAVPQYVSAGFKLEQVRFQGMVKNTAKVILRYNSNDTNYFQITEMNVPDSFVQGYGYDMEDASVEDIRIGDQNGKIIAFKDNSIRITWMKQGIVYELKGKIPQEEALKVIESMN
ncbi:MAG: hypothetical protein A4E55_01499 [Pelotomaculum sp. PtaU1.Bin035]|nr:MAG: hypothetical protein A4E55_01499 [Pelotomaculum sp. PtaU1.Bin035]